MLVAEEKVSYCLKAMAFTSDASESSYELDAFANGVNATEDKSMNIRNFLVAFMALLSFSINIHVIVNGLKFQFAHGFFVAVFEVRFDGVG